MVNYGAAGVSIRRGQGHRAGAVLGQRHRTGNAAGTGNGIGVIGGVKSDTGRSNGANQRHRGIGGNVIVTEDHLVAGQAGVLIIGRQGRGTGAVFPDQIRGVIGIPIAGGGTAPAQG